MANLSQSFYNDPIKFLGQHAYVAQFTAPGAGNIGSYVFDIGDDIKQLRNARTSDKKASELTISRTAMTIRTQFNWEITQIL